MNQKEIKELIEFLIEKDIAEFELERGDVKVRIKRACEPVAYTGAHFLFCGASASVGCSGNGGPIGSIPTSSCD